MKPLNILPSMAINSTIVEFATVGKTKAGKVYHHLWGADEITTLLKEHGLAKEEDPEAE